MKNFRFSQTFLLLLVIGITTFFSCQKDNTIPNNAQETTEINIEKVINERAQLAKHLSIIIAEQPQLKESLKTMCLAEIQNGYYEKEFFFNLKKSETIDLLAHQSLEQILVALKGEEIHSSLDYLMLNDPGLAILMIGDDESTVFNNRVYVDNGFDENDVNAQIEYYENGILGAHSINEEPKTITFVVRKSEAYLSPAELASENFSDVKKIGNISGNAIHVFGYNTKAQAISQSEIDALIQDDDVDSRSCQRDYIEKKETFHYFKTSNNHEPSWKGSGEFVFHIAFADNGFGLSTVQEVITGVDENVSYLVNREIITWTLPNDHDRMKYHIMERDGGTTYSLSLNIPGIGGNVGVSYQDNDDFVGDAIVEYCDYISNFGAFTHSAGAVIFACKER